MQDKLQQFAQCTALIVALKQETVLPFLETLCSQLKDITVAFTSMTESTELLPQLKASNYSCDTSNFVFSTVMPPGTHTAVTRALQTYFPSRSYSFLTAEGYYAGKLFVAVMKEALRKNCPDLKDVKKKCFLDTLYERGVWDVGIELGPYYRPGQRSDTPEGCNQGMQHVCEEQQTASHQEQH